MASPVSHNLVWNPVVFGIVKQEDNSRDTKYTTFPDQRVFGCASIKRFINFTVKVKYQGSEAINTDILTRHFTHHYPDIKGKGTCLYSIFCLPCEIVYECSECGGCSTVDVDRNKENARLVNAFIAKTLAEADEEVNQRIAKIKRVVAPIVILPTAKEEKSNDDKLRQLEAEVVTLKKIAQLEKEKLELQSSRI